MNHRDRPSLVWPSIGAVALVGFQAWLGRETVRLGNSGESVTAHLAAAMLLVALLVYVTVRAGFPSRLAGSGGSQRFTLLAAFATVATFALLLFGSHVTATDSALVFHAGRAHYQGLLDAGVKLYELESAFLHSKSIVVDGVWHERVQHRERTAATI